MNNIIIVTELFYPNKTSTAHIMTKFAESLVDNYKVTVLTTDIKYDDNIETATNESRSYSIIRKEIGKSNKNSILSRFSSSFKSSYILINELRKRVKHTDKVFLVTNPFNIIFFAAILRLFKKFELNLLVHDVFPENAVPAGLIKPKGLVYYFTKKVFDWSYRKPDKLLVLGRDMVDTISHKGVDKDRINILSNWYDDDVRPIEIDKESYYEIKGLDKKVIIGFAGNIGRVQGLDHFIKCFIKADNSNLALLFVGNGSELKRLTELVDNHQNIHFVGSRPRGEQNMFINSFDIGLITLAEGMYGLGVPSKSYNLLKAGKPILYIGDKNTEVDLLINSHNLGWSFEWSMEVQLIELLKSIGDIDSEFYKENNVKVATDNFSLERIQKKLITILDK